MLGSLVTIPVLVLTPIVASAPRDGEQCPPGPAIPGRSTAPHRLQKYSDTYRLLVLGPGWLTNLSSFKLQARDMKPVPDLRPLEGVMPEKRRRARWSLVTLEAQIQMTGIHSY